MSTPAPTQPLDSTRYARHLRVYHFVAIQTSVVFSFRNVFHGDTSESEWRCRKFGVFDGSYGGTGRPGESSAALTDRRGLPSAHRRPVDAFSTLE